MGGVLRDVCPCDPMPVNRWLLPSGAWTDGEDIAAWGVEDADKLAEVHAAEFDRVGALAWRIECPECGRVYAMGTGLSPRV